MRILFFLLVISYSLYGNAQDIFPLGKTQITNLSDSTLFKNSRKSNLPKLAFMGLPRIEISSDFNSLSLYGGFGFYTTYLFTGNIGPEIRFGQNDLFFGPKATVGWTNLFVQFTLSSFVPIQNKMYDVILNPKIGTSFLLGIFYLEAGYNFNLTQNFNIPNMFNLTFGIQFPMNIEKFVENI